MEPIPPTRQALVKLTREGITDVAPALLRMGRRAQAIVPDCVGLSLGLLQDGITLTLAATSDEVATFDAVQYLDGGPCVDAVHQERVVDVDQDNLLAEQTWTMYATTTAAAGVASSLTLPILDGGQVVGSVNLYAATPRAFDGHHDALAEALGASAAGAIRDADLSFRTRLEAAAAPTVLSEQHDVHVALGIIAASQGVDIATAQERLRTAAARAGITEAQAARAISAVLHPPSG